MGAPPRITLADFAALAGFSAETMRKYRWAYRADGGRTPTFPRVYADGTVTEASARRWIAARKGAGRPAGAPRARLSTCQRVGCGAHVKRRWKGPVTGWLLCKPDYLDEFRDDFDPEAVERVEEGL